MVSAEETVPDPSGGAFVWTMRVKQGFKCKVYGAPECDPNAVRLARLSQRRPTIAVGLSRKTDSYCGEMVCRRSKGEKASIAVRLCRKPNNHYCCGEILKGGHTIAVMRLWVAGRQPLWWGCRKTNNHSVKFVARCQPLKGYLVS